MRKPKTNIQILQQNVLLKHKMLIAFMRRHGPEVFTEVRAAYIDTLSKVLSSHFRAYLSAVERLEVASRSRDACDAQNQSVGLCPASLDGFFLV